jgi:hypothetical protein
MELEGNCFAQDALVGLSVQDNSFITEQDVAELLELVWGNEDSDCDNQPPPAKRRGTSNHPARKTESDYEIIYRK